MLAKVSLHVHFLKISRFIAFYFFIGLVNNTTVPELTQCAYWRLDQLH